MRIIVKKFVRWQTPTAPAQTQELDGSLGNIARVASDLSLVLGFNLFIFETRFLCVVLALRNLPASTTTMHA